MDRIDRVAAFARAFSRTSQIFVWECDKGGRDSQWQDFSSALPLRPALAERSYSGRPFENLQLRLCASTRIRGQGGLHTNRAERHYRTKVEILLDFLRAVRETGKKSRIVALANLNPASFRPYLDFCLTRELVQETSGGYRLTSRAEGVLKSIQELIARSEEVDAALRELHRGFDAYRPTARSTKPALRYVSTLAWNQVGRSRALRFAARNQPREDRLPTDLPVSWAPTWLDQIVTPEAEGPVVADQFLQGAILLSQRRGTDRVRADDMSGGEPVRDAPPSPVIVPRWSRAPTQTAAEHTSWVAGLSSHVTSSSRRTRRRF